VSKDFEEHKASVYSTGNAKAKALTGTTRNEASDSERGEEGGAASQLRGEEEWTVVRTHQTNVGEKMSHFLPFCHWPQICKMTGISLDPC
jgi:hypothetical protein